MRVVVIICTYNEAESTPKLIEALAEVFPQVKNHEMVALYVDDTSPDGTADIVRKHQKQYKWLRLLVNPKKSGLGGAYAAGMAYAMKELGADYLMEFDGDFQHPPQYIPQLVTKIDEGYDYIIGSRYVPGGSIPKSWGFSRSMLSVVGNLVARALLILPQVHDCTTGFKLSRVKGFMDQFNFDTLISKQFAYKVQLLFYMVNKGAKVVEVPFAFAPRTSGESKIIKNEMKETLRVIFWLQFRNPKIQRFFKFGVVGGTGLVLQTTIFEVLGVWLKILSPSVATVLGGEVAIISNFTLNNLWTFKDYQVKGGRIILKFLQFNFTSLIALGIQFGVLKLGESVAKGSGLVIQFFYFGAIFIVLITNYYIYNKFIWKTSQKAPSSK
ncbi:MAG: glycosyltransferase [bacterium]|nr:glycosyltransferase [bacterium]